MSSIAATESTRRLQASADSSHPTEAKRNRGVEQSAANRARREVIGHPATTEDLVYTDSEYEFMMAVRAYQERTGRKFPTTREMLHILCTLGYRKV